MKLSTFVLKTSASLLLYTTFASAQGQAVIPPPAQPSPTQAWTPAAVCQNGLANANDPNGLYTDVNGAVWTIRCGQTSDGSAIETAGTNGQGITACMNGCDNRSGCTAWGFQGTVSSMPSALFAVRNHVLTAYLQAPPRGRANASTDSHGELHTPPTRPTMPLQNSSAPLTRSL